MKKNQIVKRIVCLWLAVITAYAALPFFSAFAETDAVLSYDFESAQSAPSLFGNAALVYDEDRGSNVLSLDGTDGTYAEIPQGFFDGRNVMTITFDVLAKDNGGDYFTFTFGQNNEVYDFFRIRNNEIRNAITRWSYPNEHEVKAELYNSNIWNNIALVYNGTQMLMYINGSLAAENADTTINISDMGSNMLSYLGKSLYSGDGYFNGCFDNFKVYDRALSADEIVENAGDYINNVPIMRYTFEDNTVLPTLYGNAATSYDSERSSKVLLLDGSDSTYAALPQGLFDGKDELTVMFDIKPMSNSGNYFTFAFGQDDTKYDFFRVRGSEIRNAITVGSYTAEREEKTYVGFGNAWMSIEIVFNGTDCKLYVNGTLEAENTDTGITVSDLGSNLLAYLGKSFYSGDGYFSGCFDNFEVYDCAVGDSLINQRAMAHLPLLISASVGEVVSNLDNVSGTDSHTSLGTELNRSTNSITATLQKRQNIKAVPVTFYILNSDCKVFVDDEEFLSSGLLDLSYNRNVKIMCGDRVEEYTVYSPSVAGNPVLPGMYADPDIDVLGDRFWIFPTTDGTIGWQGTQFHAFSSKDMVHWVDEGVILDNKDKSPSLNEKGVQIASSAWSNGNAWAPSIEEKNGKYYFYYCGAILDEYTDLYGTGMAIGVAWADSPAGPYTASDAPILYPKMISDANIGFYGQVIDPSIYTEDGTSYILFGNSAAAIAELNSDMITVKTSSLKLIEGLNEFRESIAVFKRGNYYYFHWSCDDTGSENYHINYGIASSLTGSISNKGTLLQKDTSAGILATGHQSVIYLPDSDRCFIAYHRFYTPLSIGGNVGHRRETCIDEITFDKKLLSADLLKPVTPTMEGVGPVDTSGNNLTETVYYPTCTEDGYIDAGSFILGADEAPEVKASGHCLIKTVFERTCTADGYDSYTCTLCGENYCNNFAEKTGHSLTVVKGNTPSVFTISCDNCDLNKTFDFADYLNARKNDADYDVDVDVNLDGIINARDYAILIHR